MDSGGGAILLDRGGCLSKNKQLMEISQLVQPFTAFGRIFMPLLLAVSLAAGLVGLVNLARPLPWQESLRRRLLVAANLLFLLGFLVIVRFHYQIYLHLPLSLPDHLAAWLNQELAAMQEGSGHGLPLYDAARPPRYLLPVWIENSRYYFWFMCYGAMAMMACRRLPEHRFCGMLSLLLALQAGVLFVLADPFSDPLPIFFREISPWFTAPETAPFARLGQFMQLYPKMVFYYNASYMWFHPPLLFLSYACISVVFATSVFMLIQRQPALETLGYAHARFGYFLLTLGMLLGYPWALKAWGPNWWWDPKVCSSIMLWAIFSTYLHTRLYANRPGMWYCTSLLGILSFLAMIFTFLASYFFPGEHSLAG
jgi:hypothetical protein